MKQFQVDISQGAIFANGKYIPKDVQWGNGLLTTYYEMMDYLANLLSAGTIKGDPRDFYEYFLDLPNVYESRDPAIFSSHPVFIEYENVTQLEWISKGDSLINMAHSLVIVTDFSTVEGWNLVLDVLQWMVFTFLSRNVII